VKIATAVIPEHLNAAQMFGKMELVDLLNAMKEKFLL